MRDNPRMKRIALLAPLTLVACATVTPAITDGLAWARLGQTVYVDGPKVRPVAVLEDSRCPADVQCAWSGQVRISAQVILGSGTELRELTLGQPVPVADGTLELVEVRPVNTTKTTIGETDYRFGFRFMGGL